MIHCGMIECRMSWELAVWLGAVAPLNVEQHRAMLGGPYLRVRVTGTGLVAFWPIAPGLVIRPG
jgi:hypothetical protein